MVQDILPMLPDTVGTTLLVCCFVALAVGLFLWFAGAVWSRAIVTLLAVYVGGSAGMLLPRWYIWPVNSASTAVLGAVILGVLAFVIPRLFVGLTLGIVLAAWATLGTWIVLHDDAPFDTPATWQIEEMTPPDLAQDLFKRLPDEVKKVIPFAAAAAMLSALAITFLWPKVGRTLMGSTMGVTLLFLSGLTLVSSHRPEWLAYVPEPRGIQVGIFAGLVVLGALIEWQFLPVRREPEPKEQQLEPDVGR